MTAQLIQAAAAIILGVGALIGYFWGSNVLLDMLIPDRLGPSGDPIESRENTREAIRPWLFVGPAVIILFIYLVYPAFQTLWLSFGDSDGNVRVTRPIYPDVVGDYNLNFATPLNVNRMLTIRDELSETYPGMETVTEERLQQLLDNNATNGRGVAELFSATDVELEQEFVLFRNYQWAFDPGNDEFWESVRNNVLWLFVPFMSTVLGLLVAVLADRIRWGTIPRSFIFMPMAISFVGASVIWKFVYDFRGADSPQIGALNGLVVALGGQPQPWITIQPWNNLLLMVILIWIQTGFAMVLLGAALRGVPEETLEAARIDGANEIRIFFSIIIPQIMSTILVVLTTITITVLKVFDIVLTMTNGELGTQVLANLYFDQTFRAFDTGHGAAVSIVLMVAVIPIMIWNIRQFNEQEAGR